MTSNTTHVCDSTCQQWMPWGNGSEVICRVSRKVKPAPGWERAPGPAGLGKRGRAEEGAEPRLAQVQCVGRDVDMAGWGVA